MSSAAAKRRKLSRDSTEVHESPDNVHLLSDKRRTTVPYKSGSIGRPPATDDTSLLESDEYLTDESDNISGSDNEDISDAPRRTEKTRPNLSPQLPSRRHTIASSGKKPTSHARAPSIGKVSEPTHHTHPDHSRSSRQSGLARWTVLGVASVVLVLLFLTLHSGNTSSQCANLMLKPAQDLRLELLELGDFPPSFDPHDFIALFQHRIIGRPTVVHLVSKSPQLPRRILSWLRQNQPCAGQANLPGALGNFVDHASALAMKFDSAIMEPESCRVVLSVILENSEFSPRNRDWLESVVDDTQPFAYTDSGSIDTSGWCIILEDHWTGDYAKNLEDFDKLDSSSIEQRIRDLTVPKWTGRFYQRVQSIFYV